MKLTDWMKGEGLLAKDLAKKLEVSAAMITRITTKGQMPKPAVMDRIIRLTAARVTPNDWHDLPSATDHSGRDA